MTGERLEVHRMIEAGPAAIFRVLCDPQGHVAIDSSGMLRATLGILARTIAREYPGPPSGRSPRMPRNRRLPG